MKFATIALIASVSAIKISQKSTQLASRGGMHTAQEVMDGCDADGSGEVSKKEVTDCIMKHYDVPEEYRKHVVKAVNDVWPHIDTDGSGEVSLQELEAVLGKGSMLAQKELNTAADIMDACDADASGKISQQEAVDCIMKHYDVPESYRQHVVDAIEQMWPHLDHNGDGEVDLSELKAALGEEEEKRETDHGRMETAQDIMDTCDADASGKISQPEAVDCIMEHYEVPESYRQHVVDGVKQMWPHLDTNGDGGVDIQELKAAMGDSTMLAQRGGGPSAAEIMDACDTDDSGKISQPEAVNCIMEHHEIPEEYRKHVVDAVKQMWPHVDTDGDGEVDLKELEAAVGR